MMYRFVMRSILAVTLVFFMGTTARAYISGNSTSQTKCTTQLHSAGLCSIQVEGLLKGLGNVTNTPTAFAATVLIQEGSVFCKNPAGHSIEGNGVPFTELQVELSGADLINASQVSRNGRALSDIAYHDAELIAAIEDGLNAECTGGNQTACDKLAQLPCQNSNWIQTVVVTKLQVLGEQFTDPDTTTSTCDLNSDPLIIDPASCTLVDALGNKCDAPPDVIADPKSFVWDPFTYACTESCHNKTGPQCPASLPLP